jgi:hypothetical protein
MDTLINPPSSVFSPDFALEAGDVAIEVVNLAFYSGHLVSFLRARPLDLLEGHQFMLGLLAGELILGQLLVVSQDSRDGLLLSLSAVEEFLVLDPLPFGDRGVLKGVELQGIHVLFVEIRLSLFGTFCVIRLHSLVDLRHVLSELPPAVARA